MKILKQVAVIAALVGLVGIARPALLEAHKGHDHMVMGTLTMVAPDHLMVKVTDAKTKQDSVKTIAMTPTTKVFKGMPGTPAKTADLVTGSRIVVNVGEGKEPLSAKEVHIAAPATPGTK
jgi:hypothetical protein